MQCKGTWIIELYLFLLHWKNTVAYKYMILRSRWIYELAARWKWTLCSSLLPVHWMAAASRAAGQKRRSGSMEDAQGDAVAPSCRPWSLAGQKFNLPAAKLKFVPLFCGLRSTWLSCIPQWSLLQVAGFLIWVENSEQAVSISFKILFVYYLVSTLETHFSITHSCRSKFHSFQLKMFLLSWKNEIFP